MNGDGKINYSVFLAATVDKHQALTIQNLWFVFHHFDVENSGFITEEGLVEVFHREGKKYSREQIHEIIESADANHTHKISFDDFVKIMKSTQAKTAL